MKVHFIQKIVVIVIQNINGILEDDRMLEQIVKIVLFSMVVEVHKVISDIKDDRIYLVGNIRIKEIVDSMKIKKVNKEDVASIVDKILMEEHVHVVVIMVKHLD